MANKTEGATRLQLSRTDEYSLPIHQPRGRAIMGRDWEQLKKLVARLESSGMAWENVFSVSVGLTVSFLLAAVTPNPYKLWDLPIQYIFSVVAALSGGVMVTSFFGRRAAAKEANANKEDFKDWLKDVEALSDPDEAVDDVDPTDIATVYDSFVYQQAVDFAKRTGTVSASKLQRHLRVGYARAARLVDQMEQEGLVSPSDGPRPRKVLKKNGAK